MPAKIPFFTNLKRATVAEINRRAKRHGVPKCDVIEDAITLEKQATMHPQSFTGGPRRKSRGRNV